MTKVNFYPLNFSEPEARLQFACRLIEKAVSLGHQVHVHAPVLSDCRQLDELLWQFKATAFISHEIVDASIGEENNQQQRAEKVTLGTELPGTAFNDVLINLGSEPSPSPGQFKVINEVILADDMSRQHGRNAYRSYRDAGLEVTSHKI